MAKTAAERKARQRALQSENGIQKLELKLSTQELEMLKENCALRRPQREPYGMDEYVTMLIIRDNAELQAQLKEQAQRSSKSKRSAHVSGVVIAFRVIKMVVCLLVSQHAGKRWDGMKQN